MKLSTAILKGSKGRKQGTKRLYDLETGKVCALGAACLAVGIKPKGVYSNKLVNMFPFLRQIDKETGLPFQESIVEKNDFEGQSFKYIANWLRSLGY